MVPSTYKVGSYSFEQICDLSFRVPTTREECQRLIKQIDEVEKAFLAMPNGRTKDYFAESVKAALAQRDYFLKHEY